MGPPRPGSRDILTDCVAGLSLSGRRFACSSTSSPSRSADPTLVFDPTAPPDICTEDDLQATAWGARVKSLREMVSKEDSLSMRVTPEKIERNRQVSQLFFDLGMELDKMLNRQGPP